MNSTSDIIDELDGIRNNMINTNKKENKTIEDILQKNIENIESVLDSKVINMYARPWNKLESKLKLKKINEYYENINDKSEREFVIKYLNNKKKVVVSYDIDNCVIKKIQVHN